MCTPFKASLLPVRNVSFCSCLADYSRKMLYTHTSNMKLSHFLRRTVAEIEDAYGKGSSLSIQFQTLWFRNRESNTASSSFSSSSRLSFRLLLLTAAQMCPKSLSIIIVEVHWRSLEVSVSFAEHGKTVSYCPHITSWSSQGMGGLWQCTVPRAEVMFVTVQRENICPSKK
jgi:hypothetical protein